MTNSATGRGRIAGSIDQKYLEQIVQDFNKTINGGMEEEILQSSSVIFDDPIDIPEPELNEITTKVFQKNSSNDNWDNIDISDEFLADMDITYIKQSKSFANSMRGVALTTLVSPFVFLLSF